MIGEKHEIEYETQFKQIPVENEEGKKMNEIESVTNTKESCKMEQNVTGEEDNHCAAVQTRAMKIKEGKLQKPLKVTTIPGLVVGPEQLIEQQKADQTEEILEIS